MINPECVQSQVEGNILQTLSRALHEEVVYDKNGVTTVDWASYPILTFPEVPALEFELIQRLDQPPLGGGVDAGARGAGQRCVRRDRGAATHRPLPGRPREGRPGRELTERHSGQGPAPDHPRLHLSP
jgi:hypothetical protein